MGAGQFPWGLGGSRWAPGSSLGPGRVSGSTQPPSDYQASRRQELVCRLHLGYGFSESHFQDGAKSCAVKVTQGQETREPPACWAVPLWEM